MVIVMLAITSALLMSLTESTFISMRINRSAEQRIKAEYILKSAFNVAQELIKNDQPPDDIITDNWMDYASSRDIPALYLDVQEPNTSVKLLIKSEKGKIPIKAVANVTHPQWKRVLTNLFVGLGFDTESRPDISATCRIEQPWHCSSAETVANLIDYLDQDDVNHTEPGNPVQGIESDLPQGERFRNNGQIDALEELLLVPGFTPGRLNKIAQLVSVELPATSAKVNVNAAAAPVLQALAELFPGAVGLPELGSTLESCAKSADPAIGPLRSQTMIQNCLAMRDPAWPAAQIALQMNPLVDFGGNLYRVIARVEYGTGMAFMGTALYEKQSGPQPLKLKSMFLY